LYGPTFASRGDAQLSESREAYACLIGYRCCSGGPCLAYEDTTSGDIGITGASNAGEAVYGYDTSSGTGVEGQSISGIGLVGGSIGNASISVPALFAN
jgi:hypothetical protein